MSELYPDLPNTTYPNTLDQFLTYLSITSSDGPIIQQYMDAMNAGNQTLANQILATLPSASQKIITATDYNKFAQCIQAIERFYTTDIKPYIEQQQESWLNVIQQFSYEGTWSIGTSYQANNIVSYTVSGLTLLFIATSTPPAGTPPTNSNYWRTLTIQGVQGESGVGLAYRQEWSASETYQANDCVSLDGVLWMALQTNSNVQPGTNDQYWQRVISLEAATYPIQAAQPVAQDVGGIWFNTSDNPTNYYYLETLDNPATAQEIWSGYQAYDAEGRVVTGELMTYTKEEILSDSTKSSYGLPTSAVPNDAFEKLASATLHQTVEKYTEHTSAIGDMPVGSSVFLNVGGTLTEFIVVNQGIPSESPLYDASCNGTWLLMKDIYENRQWHSSDSNSYKASTIHTYLNGTFLNLFDADFREVIKQVKIPYVNGTGYSAVASGANGLPCKIFLLSGREVGLSASDNQYFPNDGAKLSYFESGLSSSANYKRIAKLNGLAANWWLRSPYISGTSDAWFVNNSGNIGRVNCTGSYGIRPALVLPSDYSYTYYTDEDGNIYAEQEYEQAITDINGNSLLTLPATQIYTGSYTGTGTYGSSNPNTLTFPFEPKLVIVTGRTNTASDYQSMGIFVQGAQWTFGAGAGTALNTTVFSGNNGANQITWNGNTISWYTLCTATTGNYRPAAQLNSSGRTYYYIAIG